jgi:surfactin synthase thioesterase subunit
MTMHGSAPQRSRLLLCSRKRPDARWRLLCLSHAGGGASGFHPWSVNLPETIEVLAAQLPGREGRFQEPPITSISGIAAALASELENWLDRPLVVFGHSFGALIGFELARLLQQHSRAPAALVVSGRRSPDLGVTEPPIRDLPDAQFIDCIDRRYGGIPSVVLQDKDLLRMFLPALRADFTALETYVFHPEPRIDCPLLVYGGRDDPQAAFDQIEGWRRVSNGETRYRLFPGDHFYLGRHRDLLLDALTEDLAALTRDVSGRPWVGSFSREGPVM